MSKSALGSNGAESFTQDQIGRCSGALSVPLHALEKSRSGTEVIIYCDYYCGIIMSADVIVILLLRNDVGYCREVMMHMLTVCSSS